MAQRRDAVQNSVDHLLLSIVGCLVTLSDFDFWRDSRSVQIFEGFRNAHEIAANIKLDVNEFPEAPVCFAGLPLALGASIPPLMMRRYFEETAQSWKLEALGATDGRVDLIEINEYCGSNRQCRIWQRRGQTSARRARG